MATYLDNLSISWHCLSITLRQQGMYRPVFTGIHTSAAFVNLTSDKEPAG